MRILFLHKNFPAQFRHLANFFASSSNNEVVFITEEARADILIPSVTHLRVKSGKMPSSKGVLPAAAIMARTMESSLRHAAALSELRSKGFVPDLIYDHAGWGHSLFVRDIFPEAAYAVYCEWYYTKEADYSFFRPSSEKSPQEFFSQRIRNLCQLNALVECDIAITPTRWQHSRYPATLSNLIDIVHDGIDINYFTPDETEDPLLHDLDLSKMQEIVTYATRGFEPYRGFPQFYKAITHILEKRPQCHVILMGEDKSCYGAAPQDGIGFAARLQKEMPLDPERVHFVPFSSYDNYRKLLRFSSVHVYLTVPFVLSWSMLEAMSCGCLLVASDTEPVREMVVDGKNGFLADFWDSKGLADKVIHTLAMQKESAAVRTSARETVCENYDLQKLIPLLAIRLEETVTSKKIVK